MEGESWSVPTEKTLNPEEMKRLMAVARKHGETYWLAIAIGANVGLRVSEVMHIKAEDLLPGGKLRVTRRKKRVLKPSVAKLPAEIVPVVEKRAKEIGKGWLFPGGAKPCQIKWAPRFLEQNCPECKKRVTDVKLVKKKGVRISEYAKHMVNEHQWDTEQIEKWIESVGVVTVDGVPGCDGKHLHIRTMQSRWRLICAEAGYAMHGRGFHQTRHYAITQFYKKTNNLRKAQEFAGHSSSAITEKYAHVADLDRDVDAMEVTL